MKSNTFSARAGHTLLELVVSVSAATMLMAGMGSTIYVSSWALDPDSNAVKKTEAYSVLNDILSDAELALSFSERTDTAVTFSVPDQNGDNLPDTIRYAWSGTPGDPLTCEFNGSSPEVIAEDVHHFKLSTLTRFMAAPPPPEPEGPTLLFVVGNVSSLTIGETARQALMETWGYTVTLIDDADAQANFDAAVVEADLAYVSGEISATALNTKLREATIGIANEEIELADEFGFASAVSTPLSNTGELVIEDGNHYITSPFGATSVTIMAAGQTIDVLGDPADRRAPDIQDLGRMNSRVNLACLETEALLKDGGTAAGRRVHLPWGRDGFDFASLTQDGQTIMKRSIEWAAGASDGGGPTDDNFGYETQFADTTSTGNGVQVGTQVTLPQDGTLNSITAYINPGGGGKDYRYAIYTDNAGEPGNLIVESAVDSQSGTGWKTISVTPTPLTAGTYWLALSFSANTQDYYHESTGGNTRHKLHPAVANGFISVWPGATTPYPYQVSIYGTYTPSP